MDISGNNMIVGSAEARMMINEGLIKQVGDELPDFFGAGRIRVTGILKPTGTFLDDAHILSGSNYQKLIFGENLLIIKTPEEELDFFYLYDSLSIPPLMKNSIDPKKETSTVNGKEYLNIIIGYDDAQIMLRDKKFSRLYDTLSDEQGSNVIVTGLPKKTFTPLDMMHFVPKKFRENYLKSREK